MSYYVRYQYVINNINLKTTRCTNTYVSVGINGAGPTAQNPAIMNSVPVNDDILGFIHLSTSQPQIGAVTAYIPPFITKIIPEIAIIDDFRQ